MGTIFKKCCVTKIGITNNEDENFEKAYSKKISENYDFSNSFDNIDHRHPTEEITFTSPLSIIESKSSFSEDQTVSKFPTCSKTVIIENKVNPLNYYEKINKIGEGTFGTVFRVRHKETGVIRVMKEIKSKNLLFLSDDEVIQEIDILKNLNNSNINKLYEFFIDEKFIYLIEELGVEGDLQSKLQEIKVFPEFIVKIIMMQIFNALSYLSKKKIIHGDLKLENILINYYEKNNNLNNIEENIIEGKNKESFISAIKNDMTTFYNQEKKGAGTVIFKKKKGEKASETHKKLNEIINAPVERSKSMSFERNINDDFHNIIENEIYTKNLKIYNFRLKLTDFGISKIFTRNDEIRTLAYSAPEVLRNDYNEQCDMWSCGVIMYLLLSGHYPFYGENKDEVTRKIFSCDYNFDQEYFLNVSEDAKNLIKKCLTPDHNKRISVEEALNHKYFNSLKASGAKILNKSGGYEISELDELKKNMQHNK